MLETSLAFRDTKINIPQEIKKREREKINCNNNTGRSVVLNYYKYK